MSDADRLRKHLDDLWRWKCGLPEDEDDLFKSEWSLTFERLMRNRLVIGALRYGRIGAPNKPAYDRIGAMRSRLQQYAETGNLDKLVDVANLALLEYVEGRHPLKHMAAAESIDHVQVKGG